MAMPMLAGVGLMMVCCSSSSVASMMMGGGDDAAAGAGTQPQLPQPQSSVTPQKPCVMPRLYGRVKPLVLATVGDA
jgi:hypothetical protein